MCGLCLKSLKFTINSKKNNDKKYKNENLSNIKQKQEQPT